MSGVYREQVIDHYESRLAADRAMVKELVADSATIQQLPASLADPVKDILNGGHSYSLQAFPLPSLQLLAELAYAFEAKNQSHMEAIISLSRQLLRLQGITDPNEERLPCNLAYDIKVSRCAMAESRFRDTLEQLATHGYWGQKQATIYLTPDSKPAFLQKTLEDTALSLVPLHTQELDLPQGTIVKLCSEVDTRTIKTVELGTVPKPFHLVVAELTNTPSIAWGRVIGFGFDSPEDRTMYAMNRDLTVDENRAAWLADISVASFQEAVRIALEECGIDAQ